MSERSGRIKEVGVTAIYDTEPIDFIKSLAIRKQIDYFLAARLFRKCILEVKDRFGLTTEALYAILFKSPITINKDPIDRCMDILAEMTL